MPHRGVPANITVCRTWECLQTSAGVNGLRASDTTLMALLPKLKALDGQISGSGDIVVYFMNISRKKMYCARTK